MSMRICPRRDDAHRCRAAEPRSWKWTMANDGKGTDTGSCGTCLTPGFSPILFLQGIPRSIAVGIPLVVGDHIDVRVSAAVLRIGGADFEYSRRSARFVYQMMPIGIAPLESRAIPRAQSFFAGVGDQPQLAI